MSDSNSFPPTFSFSNSSTSTPGMGKFTFSTGVNDRSTQTVRPRRPHNFQYRLVSASSPSPYTFNPKIFENGNAKENSKETKHGNGIPENPKTRFTGLSALTGTIPCCFEGSSYYSQPMGPTVFAAGTEESIKKEGDEKRVQIPSASQIMVSRRLKGIPQSPHFWPLRSYSEAAKQSLIDAWDRIYGETVDQILSMRVNGFWVDAKMLWETIQELQTMGYNVVPLRRRLVELSDVLKNKTRHRIEKGRLKSKAEQHMMEKNKLEFEIVKLKAKAEAEKASFEDVMAKVAKMDDEMPSFNASFDRVDRLTDVLPKQRRHKRGRRTAGNEVQKAYYEYVTG